GEWSCRDAWTRRSPRSENTSDITASSCERSLLLELIDGLPACVLTRWPDRGVRLDAIPRVTGRDAGPRNAVVSVELRSRLSPWQSLMEDSAGLRETAIRCRNIRGRRR